MTEPDYEYPAPRRRWTLRRRLVYAFGVVGGLLTIGAVAGALVFVRLATVSTDLVDHASPARWELATLGRVYADQQLAVRDFVITVDDDQLERYQKELREEASGLNALRRLLAPRPELLAKVGAVADAGASWRAETAEPAMDRARQAGPGAAAGGNVELGGPSYVALQSALASLDEDVAVWRSRNQSELVQAEWVLASLGMAVLIIAVLCGLGLWFALRRWVTDPLLGLRAQTDQVARGEFANEVHVDGPDEIVQLSGDVEAMRGYMFAALMAAVRTQEALREQADQLAESADDLRRSNAELEQFAYVASHDLQEPLRKVASFCQLLKRRYGGQLDERADQYIEFAVDGAKRMQQLINDMLAFSRVGRTTGEFTDVELDSPLQRALTSLEATVEETGAQIDADPLPTVRGNSSLLTQVFQNLVGNAVKFRGEQPPRIRITVERQDQEWTFACADNGIGIEARYAEKIFVMFQRLHPKDEYTGTGIGLALCRKIIEHHGGRIWLDTESGAGTTVRWTLPAIGEPPPAEPESTPAPDPAETPDPAAASPAQPPDHEASEERS